MQTLESYSRSPALDSLGVGSGRESLTCAPGDAGCGDAGFDLQAPTEPCPVPALPLEKEACEIRECVMQAGLDQVQRGGGYSLEEGGLHPSIPSAGL